LAGSQKPTRKGAYAASGVDINAGAEAVRLMRAAVRSTWDARVLGQYGAFAGLYDISQPGIAGDTLAVTIDGVGTKLKVAVMCGRYDSVGRDLVNHCVNDLLVQRARPLLFADYFASARLDPAVVAEAVRGMSEACQVVGCNLIAGETAEMPGVYEAKEIDLVGCMIGLVRRQELTAIRPVAPGDVLIGLNSSGLHTNGYSLARHLIFEKAGMTVETYVPALGRTVGEELLQVHREYLTALESFLADRRVHALAHLTGGGFLENIPRVLPVGCQARIDTSTWRPLPIFELLRSLGSLTADEAYRVFNMGIGMVVIADRSGADEFVKGFNGSGYPSQIIGEVLPGEARVVLR
jgi:phosphoribosylformylglycinamidine cyclo-ligase